MSWEQIGDVSQALFRCEHPKTELVWTEFNNSGDRYQKAQLRRRCVQCGRFIGSAVKHSEATETTRRLTRDEAARPGQLWREHRDRYAAEQQRQQDEWWAKYEAYLMWPEWDDRRTLVLKRAKGVCEGCGEAPASEVHHLTYRDVCAEFLFQLVALCRRCHARFHGVEP